MGESMRSTLRLAFVVAVVAALAACSQVAPKAPTLGTAGVSSSVRTLKPAGTTQFVATPSGSASGVQAHEFPLAELEQDGGTKITGRLVNRIPQKTQVGITPPSASSIGVTQGLPANASTFEGLNHFDQRYADSGNQFTVEPPDQGLCVGNGYVIEALNDVARIYRQSGTPSTVTYSLNQFFHYNSAIVRDTNNPANDVYGPSLTDPSCHYDAASGRWFLVVLTLDIIPTGPYAGYRTGTNWLDIAVSDSSDPLGAWTYYHLNVTGDGADVLNLGDYPHFAVDSNGVYITTDSFPLIASGYNGAYLYAVSKAGLLAGSDATTVVKPMVDSSGVPGYSVAPAIPVGTQTPTANGTEYFTSATTVFQSSGNEINVWALDGTDSLNTASPSLTLSSVRVPVGAYGDPPPLAPQKPGDTPLADFLSSKAGAFAFGKAPHHQQENGIATNDSGMKQTMFVNGHLWAALTTITQGAPAGGHSHGANQTGVAWYDLSPSMDGGTLSASLVHTGVIAPTGANVVFPAMTMNADGHGAIGVTLTGNHFYPSAAYVPIESNGNVGDIVVANPGAGPQDGFSEYWLGEDQNGVVRPRWGDYGAGAVDASGNLWIASEDINQTCSYAEFLSDSTCGSTRSGLANWSTQITKITP